MNYKLSLLFISLITINIIGMQEKLFERFAELPEELQLKILGYVPQKFSDIATLKLISKEIKRLIDDSVFGVNSAQEIFKQNLHYPPIALLAAANTGNSQIISMLIKADNKLTEYSSLVLCQIPCWLSDLEEQKQKFEEHNNLEKIKEIEKAQIDYINCYKTILAAGIDPNQTTLFYDLEALAMSTPQFALTSPLIQAVLHNNMHLVKLLLNAHVDVNAEVNGLSSLYIAIDNCEPLMIKLLLDNGAQVTSLIGYKILAMLPIYMISPQLCDVLDLLIEKLPATQKLMQTLPNRCIDTYNRFDALASSIENYEIFMHMNAPYLTHKFNKIISEANSQETQELKELNSTEEADQVLKKLYEINKVDPSEKLNLLLKESSEGHLITYTYLDLDALAI